MRLSSWKYGDSTDVEAKAGIKEGKKLSSQPAIHCSAYTHDKCDAKAY